MNSHESGQSGLCRFVKRVLEGRISPLQCIVLLGSFSTLVLLYISLHVCFFNVSNEISAENERVEALLERNVRLMTQYNDLVAPGLIIPLARELGMRPGTIDEVQRFAVRGGRAGESEHAWAEAERDRLLKFAPSPESRMAQ